MHKIPWIRSILFSLLVIVTAASGCVPVNTNPRSRPSSKIEGEAGRNLPYYSVSIDANYDPRLKDLIAGYKLLTVTIRNSSLQPFPMDVRKDRWVIVGEKGKRFPAVNSLRIKDPVAWREIPDKMRTLIDYPEIVPINYSVTFDLLLPKRANLDYFRQIRYFNSAWRQQFVIDKDY